MSPVSRKRKPKKARKPRQRSGRGYLSGLSRATVTAWWPERIDEVLTGAVGLLDAAGPRALEQATAELIGGVLHRALAQETMGSALQAWLAALMEATSERASVERCRPLAGLA